MAEATQEMIALARGGEDDPYWDYDEDGGCANCGGEGFVYGCSWDWQCDTYDPGEGNCLCTRRCDWCNPAAKDAPLNKILGDALRDSPHLKETPRCLTK